MRFLYEATYSWLGVASTHSSGYQPHQDRAFQAIDYAWAI